MVNQSEHGNRVVVCVLVAFIPENFALKSLHHLRVAFSRKKKNLGL